VRTLGEPTVEADALEMVLRLYARSLADWKRAWGRFSRHLRTVPASSCGSTTPEAAMSSGSSLRMAVIVSAAVLRANALVPEIISDRTHPSEKMSDR